LHLSICVWTFCGAHRDRSLKLAHLGIDMSEISIKHKFLAQEHYSSVATSVVSISLMCLACLKASSARSFLSASPLPRVSMIVANSFFVTQGRNNSARWPGIAKPSAPRPSRTFICTSQVLTTVRGAAATAGSAKKTRSVQSLYFIADPLHFAVSGVNFPATEQSLCRFTSHKLALAQRSGRFCLRRAQ